MRKTLIILIAAIIGFGVNAKAGLTADWQMHLPFDAWAGRIIETPERVYFMSRTNEYREGLSGRDFNSYALHYYDKKGDEVLTLSTDNELSDNIVSCISYNPAGKYLLVAYANCNIDFVYDDGRVENLSALKMLTQPGRKEINSISFDNANHRVYLGTSFGYVVLNDQRHEVAESRTYGESVKSVARCGENIVLLIGDEIYSGKLSNPRFNLSEYEKQALPATPIDGVYPLTEEVFLGVKKGSQGNVYRGSFATGGTTISWGEGMMDNEPNLIDVYPHENGYQITGNVLVFYFPATGNHNSFARPQEAWRNPAFSNDGKNLWSMIDRKGLRKYEKNASGSWVVTKDYMRPNSPATYICTSFEYHPDYGLLAGSNGIDIALKVDTQGTPLQISALKNSFWKEYSPLYTNPDCLVSSTNYTGLSIDPQDNKYLYRGSYFNGLIRINLKDPNDIMVFAQPSNANKNIKGFVKIVEDQKGWAALCRFTPPQFDTDGTMWTFHNNADTHRGEVYYWTAADRKATTSASSYRPMGKLTMPECLEAENYDMMIKLNSPKNKNMIAIGGFGNYGSVLLYDTNGTPGKTSDDRYVYINEPLDQDGGRVSFLAVNNLWEDPSTGLLWIMSQRGLFTVNPVTAFENPKLVNRIKVSRNDGTQLADYLLNEVNVNDLTVDGDGRKWFSTSNGLVCTSSDGRTVYGEFSTAKSPLPDDNVYAAKYNPENNSVVLGTGQGIVEMYPSGAGQNKGNGSAGPRIFPNPVEPDYFGWVRIDNISEGSLVKITDVQGGLVKELGPAQSGSVEWDVTNMRNSRVTTGVYYVMVSPGNGMTGETTISKILVLN